MPERTATPAPSGSSPTATPPSGTPWVPPAALEFDPVALRRKVNEAIARGRARHGALDQWSANAALHDHEDLLRARLVLASLPSVMEAAAAAGHDRADIYDIRIPRDTQGMLDVHDTARQGVIPTPDNIRGTARLVYLALAELGMNPRIRFYHVPRADKGGYMISVPVPPRSP